MDYLLLPPEVNSGRMYAGPGSGPMLAAAAGWGEVAAGLESAASGYSAEVSGLTGRWLGPSSMLMAAAAAPYVAWLHASAARAGQAAAQAYGAAAAFEAAFAMTVPPPVIVANRSLLMALIATNFFGQNTPAIAATEAQYMEMWAQDATAMYVYAADSSALSALPPFHEPPRTTNEAGQGAQARAAAQTAGNATSTHTQTLMQQLSSTVAAHQLTSTAVGPDPAVPANGTVTAGPGGATFSVTQGSVTVGQGAIISLGQTDTIAAGPGGATLGATGLNDITLAAGQPYTYAAFSAAFPGYTSSSFSVVQGSVAISSTGSSGSISLTAGSTAIAGANGAAVTVTIGSVTVGGPTISTLSALPTATVIGTTTTTTTAPGVTLSVTLPTSITLPTGTVTTSSLDVFSFTPTPAGLPYNAVLANVFGYGTPEYELAYDLASGGGVAAGSAIGVGTANAIGSASADYAAGFGAQLAEDAAVEILEEVVPDLLLAAL